MALRRTKPTTGYSSTTSKHLVNCDGKTIQTTVTSETAVAEEWVDEILLMHANCPMMVVGLDVEWPPALYKYVGNKSATLQLCIDTRCLILQLFYMDEIPQSLKSFLLNPKFTFVGVEVDEDISKLKNDYGLDCAKSADIRSVVIKKWPSRYFHRPGLEDLARDVAGLYMSKPIHVCQSNWAASVLNEGQVEYACIDAYASYKVAHKLFFEA